MEYEKIAQEVCTIARRVGQYIAGQREHFSFDRVEFKSSQQDMVSYVDKQAEIQIVDALRPLIPDAGFITEEGTAKDNRSPFKWVIDPLDGTTNFVHGLPPYCVSIALMEGTEVVIGVVYEITLRELFYAWKGSDAYLNGQKIEVSKTDKLENSVIAIGFSYSTELEIEDFLASIAFFQKQTHGIRRLGSAATDLIYVACGRIDAYYQVKLAPWDVAAGAFIAQRAGAKVTDYTGGANYIFGREVIASTPGIYEAVKSNVR